MKQITVEMASEYQRIRKHSAEDPGTAGDEGESNWAQLLAEWLPPQYPVVTKGRILSADGRRSKQIDVLVLKPFYPKKLREKKIWLADGIAAAFECKNTLTAAHLEGATERAKSFKALYPARRGSPEKELRSKLMYGILAHSTAWDRPGSDPISNLTRSYAKGAEKADHPSQLIDLICVADLGNWVQMFTAHYEAGWVKDPPHVEKLKAFFGGEWGCMTALIGPPAKPGVGRVEPVGAMLAHLIQRLAWEDRPLRELADYFRETGLWGGVIGETRPWPQSVFSDEVRIGLKTGKLAYEGFWNEWGMGLI